MAEADVLIVPTGAANLASVRAALARLGASYSEDASPDCIASCSALVLPGVGAFGPAMSRLRATGMADAIRNRIAAGRPTLAICLGMQLLCADSEENPGVEGLGLIESTVTRLDGDVRVPHMGWNTVRAGDGCTLTESGPAYFANSYRLSDPPAGWSVATSDYGGTFVSAMERGDVLACQFHPELSGAWGLRLLQRWLQRARVASC